MKQEEHVETHGPEPIFSIWTRFARHPMSPTEPSWFYQHFECVLVERVDEIPGCGYIGCNFVYLERR